MMHQKTLNIRINTMKIQQFLENHYRETRSATTFGDLENSILLAIKAKEKRSFQIRSVFWSVLFIFAAVGFVFSVYSAYLQFGASGALDLLKIAITDTSMVFANGSTFIYSLAETIPFTSLAEGLFTVALLLTALRHLVLREKAQPLLNNLLYGAR